MIRIIIMHDFIWRILQPPLSALTACCPYYYNVKITEDENRNIMSIDTPSFNRDQKGFADRKEIDHYVVALF